MTDLAALLKEARDWIATNGFGANRIALIEIFDAALAELEAEPERKCGTCRHYSEDDRWCKNVDSPCYAITWNISADWFCADWQHKDQK